MRQGGLLLFSTPHLGSYPLWGYEPVVFGHIFAIFIPGCPLFWGCDDDDGGSLNDLYIHDTTRPYGFPLHEIIHIGCDAVSVKE